MILVSARCRMQHLIFDFPSLRITKKSCRKLRTGQPLGFHRLSLRLPIIQIPNKRQAYRQPRETLEPPVLKDTRFPLYDRRQ